MPFLYYTGSHPSRRNVEPPPDVLTLRQPTDYDTQQFSHQSHQGYNLDARKSNRKFCWHCSDSKAELLQRCTPPEDFILPGASKRRKSCITLRSQVLKDQRRPFFLYPSFTKTSSSNALVEEQERLGKLLFTPSSKTSFKSHG